MSGYFNRGARRSGGDRRTVFHIGVRDPRRTQALAFLKKRLTENYSGPGIEEILERMEATETEVLLECIREGVFELEGS